MTGSKSICLYGSSDSGKTAQAARFARHIYETTGKVTRAIVTDQGGSLDVWQPYIEAGVIEPWYIGGVPDPLAILFKLARGSWPQATPGPNGRVLRFQEPSSSTWERVGAYIIDSGTEACEQIKDVSLRGKGVRLAQDPSFKIEEANETFYGGNMTYYGFAQDVIVDLIRTFNALPVQGVLWTMGEGKGEEEGTRETIYGPETVGKALRTTGKLPKKFGDLLHLDVYNVVARDKDGKEIVDVMTGKPVLLKRWRIYFQTHPDMTTGINYPAKPRLPPELLPELWQSWRSGFLSPHIENGEMVDGLDAFLRREAELLATPVAAVAAWKASLAQTRTA
jgi:hypothetical protein